MNVKFNNLNITYPKNQEKNAPKEAKKIIRAVDQTVTVKDNSSASVDQINQAHPLPKYFPK